MIALQFINQLKVHYYKDRLVFPDLYIMTDVSNAATLLHYPSAGLAIVGLVLFVMLTLVVGWRAVPRRQGVVPMLIAVGMMAASGALLSQCITRYQQDWAGTMPGGTGVVSNLVMSARQLHYHPPSFTEETAQYFTTRAAALNRAPQASASEHPDIVLLLQESTADPRLYKLPAPARLPHFSMFEPGPAVKAHTHMRVQTFGGGTWLSEFSALTGLRSDDFGAMKNAVFYSIIDHVNDSLFKQMKANGYYTVVLTPFNKSAYNARHAYTMMGVDKIIQPQELGYPGSLQDNLWHITTADMLSYVKKIMSTYTDKPLFIYALTMSEHGPYDAAHKDDYQLSTVVKNADSAGKFSHYVEKIKNSDTAMADFFQFVDQRHRPTMFMYFGDHQPAINWANGYASPLPDAMHLTQFSLRDNVNMPQVSGLGTVTDIAFLGGILLEQARLKVSPFYQANIDMRYLCKGLLNECADKQLFNSYRHYIYNRLRVAS
ncbi:phosphoglycerol transferase MdoB-like AlkP superfamily enzyme [Erwinia toletana]|uniref:Phosphoglycerol transferase MdoB-like AlkP superfamily enzyme n=1 Tax=Winslowiella toletana TaxID=92490 RepID=A0ABS4PFE7_9GAMM|nr:phosphoglycerol transferase MdoB-like AlkP superfamily enzyme [Winslowiella toletana]